MARSDRGTRGALAEPLLVTIRNDQICTDFRVFALHMTHAVDVRQW